MKVLLIVPKYTSNPGEFYQFPLGLGYISSAMKRAGHEVVCLNCNNDARPVDEQVLAAVREHGPAACATGALSPFLPQVKAIFRAAREGNPTIFNIVGGGVLSSDPEAGIALMDVDAGVIGEGELTIVDLCNALEAGSDLNTVAGVVFPDKRVTPRRLLAVAGEPATGRKVVRTASRESIADLGRVAWPDYEGLGFGDLVARQRTHDNYFYHSKDEPRCADMVTSRSCPYRCTFCFHPTGKIYRERPLDDFFEELVFMKERYQINMVALIDELFSLKKARLFEFCERIKPFNLEWMVQLHVNVADGPVLDAMRDAGCTYISYGVESMSPPVLTSMQKGSHKPRIHDVLNRTHASKIGIQGNLIFGDTAETLDTANESMAWWAQNRHLTINANRLQVYPGSPDFIEAVRDGLVRERLAVIDDLRIDINISRMNDENLSNLGEMLQLAQSTLLRPAKVREFTPEASDERGESSRVGWDCPRCEHENDFRRVILSLPTDRHALRLTCRGCQTRFDVENMRRVLLEARPSHAADQALCAEAAAASARGDEATAEAVLLQLAKRSCWFHPAQTALARNYLARAEACGDDVVERARFENMARRRFGEAVRHNPYDHELHMDYADVLWRIHAFGMAKLHAEQAQALCPGSIRAAAFLRVFASSGLTPAQISTYFVSVSDAAAPTRLGAESGCSSKKKREAEFPDVGAIEAQVFERMGAE